MKRMAAMVSALVGLGLVGSAPEPVAAQTKAETEAKAAGERKIGNPALPLASGVGGASGATVAAGAGSAKAEWNEKIDARVKATGHSREAAASWVARNYPELRERVVAEANPGKV